jgi:4-aminobutyrate aminotransferase
MNLDLLKSEGDLNLTPSRAAWSQTHIDPQTQEWLEEDARYFLHQSLSTPCLNVLQRSEGAWLEDFQGRRYLDFHGNNVHQVGFGHPKVIEAVVEQMRQLPFCPRRYTNLPAIQLARKLAELAPGDLNRVLLAPGGTTAIGMAIKLARVVTGRYKTISWWDSFHGASLDAISVGGEAVFRRGIGPLLPGCEHVPPPDATHCIWGCQGKCNLKCADYLEYVLEKEGDVAAVIAETVRCTPFIPPPEYWHNVRRACDRHGTLLILDEIPICLGRTGRMFACEHYGIVPDMLVIGKGLGGGVFPLAALLAREELNVAANQALGHYTHEKNPVAAAAALATIKVIEEEGLLQHCQSLGAYTLDRLKRLQSQYPAIGDVRGLGLLLGVELVKDRQTMTRDPESTERILYAALAKGLSFKLTMGNILTLTPPLNLTQQEMDQALEILSHCFKEVVGLPGGVVTQQAGND